LVTEPFPLSTATGTRLVAGVTSRAGEVRVLLRED
jgi:hypothetical protein